MHRRFVLAPAVAMAAIFLLSAMTAAAAETEVDQARNGVFGDSTGYADGRTYLGIALG